MSPPWPRVKRVTASNPTPGSASRPRRGVPVLAEVFFALITVALVQAFLVKPFGVPSESMENTLHVGDRIAVNRLDDSVERFDVIVFGHGATWSDTRLPPSPQPFKRVVKAVGDVTGIGPSNTSYTVKRVIGLPGDKVSCCSVDGRVEVNGDPIKEPYIFENIPFTAGTSDCSSTPRSTRCFPVITVPKENYLVLGDHRSASADSVIGCRGGTDSPECAKFVPASRIIGPVGFKFWPISDIGGIAH